MSIEVNLLSLTVPECWMKQNLLRDSLCPMPYRICVLFRQIKEYDKETSYPKIADKKNFSILTDVFTFEMDKEMRGLRNLTIADVTKKNETMKEFYLYLLVVTASYHCNGGNEYQQGT